MEKNSSRGLGSGAVVGSPVTKVRLQLVPNTGQKSRGIPVVVEGPTYAAIAQAARNKLSLVLKGGKTKHKAGGGKKKQKNKKDEGLRLFLQDGTELFPPPTAIGGGAEGSSSAVLPLKQDTVIVVSSGEAFVSSAGRLLEDDRRIVSSISPGGAPQSAATAFSSSPSAPMTGDSDTGTRGKGGGERGMGVSQFFAAVMERLPPDPLVPSTLVIRILSDDEDKVDEAATTPSNDLVDDQKDPVPVAEASSGDGEESKKDNPTKDEGRRNEDVHDDDDDDKDDSDDIANGTASAMGGSTLSTLGDRDHSVISSESSSSSSTKRSAVMTSFDFVGPFPVMEGNVMPLLREAIQGCDDFMVSDCGEYVAFDYRRVTKDTFPDPELISSKKKQARLKWMMAARRECRGLIVSQRTGCVLARRFHKFFNVDERPESAAERIILDGSVVLTEKLDGCLVSPVLLPRSGLVSSSSSGAGGSETTGITTAGDDSSTEPLSKAQELLWVTKAQPVLQIEEFVVAKATIADYQRLAVDLLSTGITPLFEWCDPTLGVIEHRAQSLTLLAARENVSGKYLERDVVESIASKYRVPLTPRIPLDLSRTPTTASLKAHVDSWEPGVEGLVITMPGTGLMYKLKSHWYRTLHSNSGIANLAQVLAKRPSLSGVPISMIWSAIISGHIDDLLPLLRAAHNDKDSELLSSFLTVYHSALERLRRRLLRWGAHVRRSISEQLEGIDAEMSRMLGSSAEKVGDIVLQQLALKLGGGQSSSSPSSSASFLWTKKRLHCFVKPEPITSQERSIEEIIKSLASKGQWPLLEALLGLSWRRTYASGRAELIGLPQEDGDLTAGDKDGDAEGHSLGTKDASYSNIEEEKDDDEGYQGFEPRERSFSRSDFPEHIQIFCDLDGVLADFESGIQRISRSNQVADGSPQMWALIRKNKNFWLHLDLIEGASELWAYLRSRPCDSAEPKILTGIPDGKMGVVAREQKQAWCRKHLGPIEDGGQEIEVITCQSSKKSTYSRFGHVLIDDRDTLREDWERMGGTFIHHKHPSTTLEALRGLLPKLKDRLESVRELLQQRQPASATGGGSATSGQLQPYFSVPETAIILVEQERNLECFCAAMKTAQVVGLDVEWPPDNTSVVGGGLNRASLLQVALNEHQVFLIDLLCLHDDTKRAISELFENTAILKLGFGFQEDLNRVGLGCGIKRLLDFTRVVPILMADYAYGSIPSLGRVVERVLGLRMQKSKILQAFDWSVRPLPLTHQQYAAADAACLVILNNTISQWPSLRAYMMESCLADLAPPSKRQRLQYLASPTALKNNLAGAPSSSLRSTKQRFTLQYTAIFLDSESRARLLAAIPARFPSIYAHHVTLSFSPSVEVLRELPVGESAQIRVLGQACDESVQAVAVELVHPQGLPIKTPLLHITISTKPGIPPSQSNELLTRGFEPLGEKVAQLSGVVGLMVANEFIVAELPPQVLSKIEEFRATGLPGQYLELGRKHPLTAMERQAVHKYAEEHGLESSSTGRKHERVVMLRIPRNKHDDQQQGGSGEGGIVHDLRIMKSGNEDENRRLMRNETRFKQKPSSSAPQLIQVTDEATLKSLQLVFKSIESANSILPETNIAHHHGGSVQQQNFHGFIQSDGNVQLLPSVRLPLSDRSQHELVMRLFGGEEGRTALLEERVVIIMRGLPGSGKSSLVRSLIELVHDRQLDSDVTSPTVICSADEFWQRGAGLSNKEIKRLKRDEGMTDDDIYAHCWDESRLGEAHEYCMAQFRAALDSDHSFVVVDNVNSLHRDYAPYSAAARSAGYSVLTIEIVCNGDDEMMSFHKRGRHRVPIKAMAGMRQRWESDPSAILLAPYLSSSSSTPRQLSVSTESFPHGGGGAPSSSVGGSLMQWLSQRKLFGARTKHRKPTHMITELEDRPSKFIFVPPESYTEFLQCYAADDSPKYLVENCSTPVCPLFIDLDYIADHELSPERTLEIVSIIQRTIQELYPHRPAVDLVDGVIVTGGAPYQYGDPDGFIKSGRHLFFPRLLVTLTRASAIANAAATRLASSLGEDTTRHWPWMKMLDMAVYTGPEPNLRMLGSRKTVRNRASGRWVDAGTGVHTLRAIVDANGALDVVKMNFYRQNPIALLKAVSIRTEATTETQGFIVGSIVNGTDSSHTTVSATSSASSQPGSVSMTAIDLDDLPEFTPAKEDLVDHVVHRYLPRKLANFLGIALKSLTDATPIRLSRSHGPSEGKIRGMWEQFSKSGIIDLRVDLQPQRKEGRTSHYGDEEFANWQVQYGPSQVCKSSSRAKPGLTAGAFAGVFMRTEVEFSVGHLKKAMALSFATRKYVCLDVSHHHQQLPLRSSSIMISDDQRGDHDENADGDDSEEDEEEEEEAESESLDEDDSDDGEEHSDGEGSGGERGRASSSGGHARKVKHKRKSRHRQKYASFHLH